MAGIFNQAKDLFKLQKEARAMQKKMKAIRLTGLSDDELVTISIDGTQEILDLTIADELLNPESKRDLIRGIKQATKNAQQKLQKEMMKDMDMSQIKNMLG
ncbi:MAG: YbaB/EbfC family nucleoid-associated protein [bacterium]